MTDLTLVFGTRPEAIKLGPVAAELRALGLRPHVLCTGQHTDLLRGTPAETDLGRAVSLGLPSGGDVGPWVAAARPALQRQLETWGEQVVVVQGDTMSAWVGAETAHAMGLPVAHVEAGIRSHTAAEPYPEEELRCEITKRATWHFAPTSTAFANLMADGVRPERIVVTGNPVISALARYTGAQPQPPAEPPVIRITLHRRELTRNGRFPVVLDALRTEAVRYPHLRFAWPVHPAVEGAVSRMSWPESFSWGAPQSYRLFAEQLSTSWGVLTDSGGVSEEAAALGVPCAVLRGVTDRPEAIEAGVAARFDPTPEGVRAALRWLAEPRPRRPTDIFGTPAAASLIARHLASQCSTS